MARKRVVFSGKGVVRDRQKVRQRVTLSFDVTVSKALGRPFEKAFAAKALETPASINAESLAAKLINLGWSAAGDSMLYVHTDDGDYLTYGVKSNTLAVKVGKARSIPKKHQDW